MTPERIIPRSPQRSPGPLYNPQRRLKYRTEGPEPGESPLSLDIPPPTRFVRTTSPFLEWSTEARVLFDRTSGLSPHCPR